MSSRRRTKYSKCEMAENNNSLMRFTIRIGRSSLAMLAQGYGSDDIVYEPYVVKSGVSMAANLREAFKNSDLLLQAPPRVRVLLDSEVLVIPLEQFSEENMEVFHNHAFPRKEQDAVFHNVLPDLNAVALFSVNKDLKLVLDDHFKDVRLITIMQPVWRHLHQRSFTGVRPKLYAYFHEKHLELFAFQQNRFKFCNSFEANRTKDALYFIMYVWKQLNMMSLYDELHLVGDIPEREALLDELKKYVQKVYVINPSADFNQHPVMAFHGMPYDLQTLVVKGR